MPVPLAAAAAALAKEAARRVQVVGGGSADDDDDDDGYRAGAHDEVADESAAAAGVDGSEPVSSSADCWAIVPVVRARFPEPGRLPLVVRATAPNCHVHFLMDEDLDESELTGAEVTCRALVLHPTRAKSSSHGGVASRPKATIDWLPHETLSQVFRFLPAPSLCAAEAVCPLWRDIASREDTHWTDLCQKQYGISPDNFTPPPDPVKLLYLMQAASLSEIKYGTGRSQWLRFM